MRTTKVKMKKKIFCFDIDGVICNNHKKKNINYKKSFPNFETIHLINKIYDRGHKVIIFTSRYMGRNKENKKLAIKQGFKSTKKQLKTWGLKYNKLIFGKPSYDYIIDDRSIDFKKNWHNRLIKKIIL